MNKAVTPKPAQPKSQSIALTTGGKLQRKRWSDQRQSRYLAYSVVLEEAGSPRLMRLAMLTVTLVVGAFLIWSWFTPVREVSSSFGQVITSDNIHIVQHLEGGIVQSIAVEDGKPVKKGDVLMTLEPTGRRAELDQMRSRRDSLLVQMERIRAFVDNREPDFTDIKSVAQVKADQLAILQQSRLALDSQRAVLAAQVSQQEQDIQLLDQQETEALRDITLLEEELELQQGLLEKGLISRVRVITTQRDVNSAKSRLTQARGDRNRSREALTEIKQRLVELDDRARSDALNQMGILGTELAQVQESMRKLEDRVQRLELRSPATGMVNGLIVTTIGGVVAPGAPIMEIVPDGDALFVEAKITTRDIGHLVVGQSVLVKVVTYDFARYGGVPGILESISPTTFLENGGEPYYKGRVALSQTFVGRDPRANHLAPGMTVQADITTGEKTIFQYLMKPIYTTLNESFRER